MSVIESNTHWIYASIQSNIVNVTFDLKKGSFASIMGFKTKGDGFFTLVRLLLIFFTQISAILSPSIKVN